MKRILILLWLGLHTCAAGAEDRLELDTTTIVGNRELPRITFVVPWRTLDQEVQELPLQIELNYPPFPLDSVLYSRQIDNDAQTREPEQPARP